MTAISLLILVSLISISHQAEELSFSITYKSDYASSEDVKSVVRDLLPNQKGSTTPSCECSRMEEVFRRNRILMCGVGIQYKWKVKDDQFTASTYYQNHQRWAAYRGRLFATKQTDDDWGYWAGYVAQVGDWLEVDLLEDVLIYGVVTQGRADFETYPECVQSYSVQYRTDGSSTLETITNDEGEPMEFQGNTDNVTPVFNEFPTPIKARRFRINVISYIAHPSLRFELLIC